MFSYLELCEKSGWYIVGGSTTACYTSCRLGNGAFYYFCFCSRLPSFDRPLGRQHSFVEIDHEIFAAVILSLLLIQEEQLLVSGGLED